MDFLNRFKTLFAKPEPLLPSTSALAELSALPSDRRGQQRLNAREGLKVLVIDDSPTVCAALKKILKSAKLEVELAMDAESGLQQVKLMRPDLIFLDIVLPRMNGFSALRQLRRDPQTRDIPVIMISGNEMATEQFFGSAIGADDFMKKPFSRQEVFARIEPLLDGQQVTKRRQATNSAAPVTAPAPLTASSPLGAAAPSAPNPALTPAGTLVAPMLASLTVAPALDPEPHSEAAALSH